MHIKIIWKGLARLRSLYTDNINAKLENIDSVLNAKIHQTKSFFWSTCFSIWLVLWGNIKSSGFSYQFSVWKGKYFWMKPNSYQV